MTHQLLAILFLIAAVAALILAETPLGEYFGNKKILLAAELSLLLLAPALAGLTVAFHFIGGPRSANAVDPLTGPILFVLCAVPLSILLDRLGFFSLIAAAVLKKRHDLFVLWMLAATVTATLNLDTAVVLLTPIYVDIARKKRLPPLALAVQPALLSGIASLFLPISNLTNLIFTSKFNLTEIDFLDHLGISGILAVLTGFFFYRITYTKFFKEEIPNGKSVDSTSPTAHTAALTQDPVGPGPVIPENKKIILLFGSAICILAAAGFTFIPLIGGSPWEVALGADVVLIIATKSFPWRHIPLRIAVNVFSLAVLASSFEHYVHFKNLLSANSNLAVVKTGVLSGVFSSLANNLPSTLGFAAALGRDKINILWPVLVGTNIGSLLLPGGSLAIMLWLSTLKRLDAEVSGMNYIKYAWRIALPTFLVALGGLLLIRL